MKYHWKVNGEGACQSKLTMDDRLRPSTRCEHATRKAIDAEVARFSALFPSAKVEIFEGNCDDPGREDPGYDE